ncbi:MAG: transcription-repair coupling factor [Desulfosarcina sp.]|nr:transcription-repair coupling factor [Desulfosarcina sp.]MBC2765604.1 transcription-repair coupling factor [Desulfosarcina sp.]
MDQMQEKSASDMLIRTIAERTAPLVITGISSSAGAYLAAGVRQQLKSPVLVVVESTKAAEQRQAEIDFFSGETGSPAVHFPSYNISPFKFMSYHNETAARRIRALYSMIEGHRRQVTVTTAAALRQRLIPKSVLAGFAELIIAEEEIEPDRLVAKLVAGGYTRSVVVEEPGDFCVRGGIIDIFSPLYDNPLRIELFGDFAETIRFFSPASQRSLDHVHEAVILPAREVTLEKARLDVIVGRFRVRALEQELPRTTVRDIVQRIKEQGVFPGIESLTPLIYDRMDTLFDYLPDNTVIIAENPAELAQAAEKSEQLAQVNYDKACSEKRLCVEPKDLFLNWEEITAGLARREAVSLAPLAVTGIGVRLTAEADIADNSDLVLAMDQAKKTDHPAAPLVRWITAQKEAGHTVVMACESDRQGGRLAAIIEPHGVDAVTGQSFPQVHRPGRVFICRGRLSEGFVWSGNSLSVATEAEIFGPRVKRPRPGKSKVHTELMAFSDLKQGDLVVHDEHGIGQYEGLVKLSLEGTVNDFLLIVYRNDDRLYLPVDRMGLIQKYMGVEGMMPALDKMGGRSWERAKEKVRQSAEKIAGELLKIYAQRKVKAGHGYGAADSRFADFETDFPYEETQDQLKAIEDVLEDMRNPSSMDRLVCGDVGYGKTEVALRASFLAVSEARQVAILVPTTVLAEQHYATFVQRFDAYPVKMACLSRFRSRIEQRRIVEEIKKGTVDIVIGTHRLLQKDVAFADLGLFIIDEEQRFGVRHKEKLKRLRTSVDVLALTATPIPRTLHLSMMGIRDISVISTPPEQRHAIITYVCEFDDTVISEAIRSELARGGQIFFVHNNVRSIDRMAAYLQERVPEVRLAVAHGQMAEENLEKMMMRFMEREVDMLVCTTIIESGIDVATANTILVNRADRFGLAQIYQLRGRVGRSDEQAYAYLFIPEESRLGKDAQKRLKVLMEHSDLGSGFQIAMNDLKIRGGGAILGASQSGHIAAVGYDMFLKLMEEAVAQLKGEPRTEGLEPEINLPMSAYMAEDYVADIDQRLSLYRRLAKMSDLKEIAAMKAELADRFGPLPEETENLLFKIMLRVLSVRAGVKRLDLYGRQLCLAFSEAHQHQPLGIVQMLTAGKQQYQLTPDHLFKTTLAKGTPRVMLAQTKNILIEIAQHVNS